MWNFLQTKNKKSLVFVAIFFLVLILALASGAVLFFRHFSSRGIFRSPAGNLHKNFSSQSPFPGQIQVISGAVSTPNYLVGGRMELPIIVYHYVEHVQDSSDRLRQRMNINPEVFEQQLQSLINGKYSIYFVRDIPDILSGKMAYSSPAVVLTFDDGYSDFYYDVFPLLKKYQAKATLYLVCDYLGWSAYVTKDQVQELLESGLVEIGSHTLDHVNLREVSLEEERRQIFDSKRLLEATFGRAIETFAYPYGSFNQQVVDLVKAAQYTAAVTAASGIYQESAELYTLTRLPAGRFVNRDIVKELEEMK